MKVVYVASDRIEAEIVAGKLKDAGLPVIVKYDDEGGMMPGLQYGSGIKIVVSDDVYEEALEIVGSKIG